MKPPSLKFGLCTSVFSQHNRTLHHKAASSRLASNQLWSDSRLELVRVASTYCNKDKIYFIVNYDKSSLKPPSTYSLSGVHRHTVRRIASIPEFSGKAQKDDFLKENKLTLPQKIVQRFPVQYHPYLKLSRIDRPIGTWLLFWPSTWGLTVASGGIPDLKLLALFGAGAFVMRGAGCTVNDMWDRHIDPQVKRTSTRPLAARQIRMRHAAVWLSAQLSIAFGILLQLNPSCFLISCGALGLVCLYPLAKRVTHWPQAVLGLTFNTGILIGYAAANPSQTEFFDMPYLDPTCVSLYISGILWTLIYDTIYAHQDLQDDTLLGLGSTARRFGEHTKLWLTGFSGLMVSSLTMAGMAADLSYPYYLGIGGVSAHLFWQIWTLNTKDATNCGERFNANRHIGWLILMSLLASYWVKDADSEKQMSSKRNTSESKENLKQVTKYTGFAPSSL